MEKVIAILAYGRVEDNGVPFGVLSIRFDAQSVFEPLKDCSPWSP